MPLELCRDCKFWEWDNQPSESEARYGICHRYPKLIEDYVYVKENYWCGEWKGKSQLRGG
jgi:hypothetical protein